MAQGATAMKFNTKVTIVVGIAVFIIAFLTTVSYMN